MLGFLHQLHHFPRCRKDGFVTLLPPEVNVEFAIPKTSCHQTVFPFGADSSWFTVYSFGPIPNVFILRYRLLRSSPSSSAVRVTFQLVSSSFLLMYSFSAASRTSCRLPK